MPKIEKTVPLTYQHINTLFEQIIKLMGYEKTTNITSSTGILGNRMKIVFRLAYLDKKLYRSIFTSRA